jgi:hypothetical protein
MLHNKRLHLTARGSWCALPLGRQQQRFRRAKQLRSGRR